MGRIYEIRNSRHAILFNLTTFKGAKATGTIRDESFEIKHEH
jgi:hypothetical protein